jgi:AbrB family looped-hinge helix DNA binding protein
MNVGTYVQPTDKGQIVIPADYREELGITKNTLLFIQLYGGSINIQPVTPIMLAPGSNEIYLEFLAKNRGAWGPETPGQKKLTKKMKAMELARSEKLKNAW